MYFWQLVRWHIVGVFPSAMCGKQMPGASPPLVVDYSLKFPPRFGNISMLALAMFFCAEPLVLQGFRSPVSQKVGKVGFYGPSRQRQLDVNLKVTFLYPLLIAYESYAS